MCFYLIFQGKPYHEVTHMLGLMATAGFRMIPSFSRILNNLQSIRYGWASVDVLAEEMGDIGNKSLLISQSKNSTPITFTRSFGLKNASFGYEANNYEILNGVNFEVKKGECIGIVGESGVGKSTLINLLLGLVSPSSGILKTDGYEIEAENIQSWQKIIGYVPQEIYLLDDTIQRNIAFGVNDAVIDQTQIRKVVEKAGVSKLIDSFENGLHTEIGERGVRISGGQRQRIGIARALYQNPQILILDEATSALDKKIEKRILEELQLLKGDITIIIISHRPSTLQFCDRIYRIENRKLVVESKDNVDE